nr:nuclease-related domain-containing protein [uncultured Pedobacter sp.]
MEIVLIILFFVGSIIIFIKVRDKKLLETVTKSDRGTRTERKLVLKLLKFGTPAVTIFHDLYVKKRDGNYTQIDLVVATKVGIIVFEVKDYKGWIFGTGYKPQWTQVLSYGKIKHRFYNPILQNNKHIEDLRKQLKQFENIPFYSIVVFYGDSELKDITFVPEGTFIVKPNRISKVLKMILKNNEPAHYTNKREVVNMLKDAVKNGENSEVQSQHIENVNDMLGRDRVFD